MWEEPQREPGGEGRRSGRLGPWGLLHRRPRDNGDKHSTGGRWDTEALARRNGKREFEAGSMQGAVRPRVPQGIFPKAGLPPAPGASERRAPSGGSERRENLAQSDAGAARETCPPPRTSAPMSPTPRRGQVGPIDRRPLRLPGVGDSPSLTQQLGGEVGGAGPNLQSPCPGPCTPLPGRAIGRVCTKASCRAGTKLGPQVSLHPSAPAWP